jgi:Flp pilus assembly protein TadD
MSLLLEALKKAAQEKQAQQRSEPSGGQDVGGRGSARELSLEPVEPHEPGPGPEPDMPEPGAPPSENLPDLQLESEERGSQSEERQQGTPYERPLAIEPPDARKASVLPRMQGPEPASALSPEAARRVFDSKRGGSTARTRLFVLGGFGVVVLMAVVLSLFYYSSQVANLDQQIASFRREPRAMAPPPPRPSTPVERPADSAEGSGAAATEPGDAPAKRDVAGAPIIDQVEEGVVAASETGDVAEGSDETSEPLPARKTPSGTQDDASGLKIEPRRRGSVRVTSVSPDRGSAGGARVSRDDIVVRSKSRIPDADRLRLEAYEAYQAGDLQRAERAYGLVLRSSPDDRDALLGLAAIQQRRGSNEGAIAIYRRLLELNPKDSVARSALLELGAAQGAVGETDLKLMLRDQPDAPHLHFALGNVYAARERWSQAQGAYFDAYRLAPGNADYAFNLAVSLDRLDKPGAARNYYEQALVAARRGAPVSFSPQSVERRLRTIANPSPGS